MAHLCSETFLGCLLSGFLGNTCTIMNPYFAQHYVRITPVTMWAISAVACQWICGSRAQNQVAYLYVSLKKNLLYLLYAVITREELAGFIKAPAFYVSIHIG